jgi:hypothetical protein
MCKAEPGKFDWGEMRDLMYCRTMYGFETPRGFTKEHMNALEQVTIKQYQQWFEDLETGALQLLSHGISLLSVWCAL